MMFFSAVHASLNRNFPINSFSHFKAETLLSLSTRHSFASLNFSLWLLSVFLLELVNLLKGFNVTPALSFKYLNVGFASSWKRVWQALKVHFYPLVVDPHHFHIHFPSPLIHTLTCEYCTHAYTHMHTEMVFEVYRNHKMFQSIIKNKVLQI